MNERISQFCCLACCLGLCAQVGADTIYVDVDATGEGNGQSWIDAYTSPAAAIADTMPGDEVWVAEGTYGPVILKDGVKLYGGFSGDESALTQADPDAHKTCINGRGTSRAVESFRTGASTILWGLNIVDGFIGFPGTGGGVYLENSSAMFVNCVFARNRAVTMGGAVAVWGGSPMFANCRFHGNDGGWAAGAVFIRKSATPTFVNCLFYDNTAMEAGAASILTGEPMFINCTVADNEATVGKGGALFDASGNAALRNCILWGNTSALAGTSEIYSSNAVGNGTEAAFSIIKGGWAGEGNLDKDPLFVDAAKGDYRLQASSPCRDTGLDTLLPTDAADLGLNGNTTETLSKDLDLNARVNGEAVDMGAFEWHP